MGLINDLHIRIRMGDILRDVIQEAKASGNSAKPKYLT